MTRNFLNYIFGIYISSLIVLVDSKGVLLIIGGDTGLELGAYNNSDVSTQSIDRLASNGVLFKRAYTSSVSGGSSSRSEILTGIPAHQNGMFGPHSLPSYFRTYDDVVSISKILSAEGVATGMIGLESLGPESVFGFNYRQTDSNHDDLSISRNISFISSYVKDFLTQHRRENFFLVVSLGDAERCKRPEYGQFCEDFGDEQDPAGSIPGWKPSTYNASSLRLPYYIPDLEDAREDLASLYRSINRLDQGVGLIMSALVNAGLFATTLTIFTSTGGVGFPGAKYNALDSGSRVPLIIASSGYSIGQVSDGLVSTLDIAPTIMDYFGLPFPKYSIAGKLVVPTGISLVPLLTDPTKAGHSYVFSAQNFLQVNQEFPIRAIRNESYTLIWNKWDTFPIAAEIFNSLTYTYLVNQSKSHHHSNWWIELPKYLHRDQYELYDLTSDPYEVYNVATEPRYRDVFQELQALLKSWQLSTFDPWLCSRGFINIKDKCVSYL
ncbi:N-sulfoglucosamine sulfohydrolase [Biomphalaria pfeifferi]|uniref:N-sulfoglucosamine sulfohydrolase n=1 Tax=Biomphalaria pfeifferi TaxID=112525 RepID=A0AAD8F882_BIOPF|nr:N-sulfoglucosamine sulfohydrolase [Biomphalaria pfeifferi]